MNKGWEVKPLQEICDVFVDGDWIETKNQSSEGIRLIQTGNIGFGFYKDKADKARYISEDTFKKLKCTEVLAGDLLVSRLPDPVGKSCLIPQINFKMITGVDCTIIRLKDNILPEYLRYYQMSEQYLRDVNLKVTGTTRSRISRKNLGTINIPYPHKDKQKKIVDILDNFFKKIDQAKNNIEQNIENTKELFQSRLNEIFSQKGEGWEEKKLYDLCENGKSDIVDGPFGSNLKREHFVESGIPVLKIQNIKPFEITHKKMDYVTEEKYIELKRHSYKSNDIIMTKLGDPLGASAIVPKNEYGLIVADLVRIRASKINIEYLCYHLNSKVTQDIINSQQKGATRPRVKIVNVRDLPINVPNQKMQVEIVNDISKLKKYTSDLIEQYQQKLEDCEELKKSMLQKAFKGELVP